MEHTFIPAHQFLRLWRKYRNLTLAEVADRLKIKVNTLSDKELGKRPVTLPELANLAEIYEMDIGSLLRAPPGAEQLERLNRVNVMMDRMSEEQLATWLEIGETLAKR